MGTINWLLLLLAYFRVQAHKKTAKILPKRFPTISQLPAAFKFIISKSCYEGKSQKNLFGPRSRLSHE
jgi:hypothetical protein